MKRGYLIIRCTFDRISYATPNLPIAPCKNSIAKAVAFRYFVYCDSGGKRQQTMQNKS